MTPPKPVAWVREVDGTIAIFTVSCDAPYTVGPLWKPVYSASQLDAARQEAFEEAAGLHESVDCSCDHERNNKAPGAGAMGAVIEYRNKIREAEKERMKMKPYEKAEIEALDRTERNRVFALEAEVQALKDVRWKQLEQIRRFSARYESYEKENAKLAEIEGERQEEK